MTTFDRSDTRQAIEALNVEFAWLIDHRDGAGVEHLFTEDGVYDMSNARYRGRAEIKAFYDIRKSRGQRTARHIFSNLRLEAMDDQRATGTTILTLYAADGDAPFTTQALLIADYNDTYARAADGRWLYETRVLVPLFGGVPALGRRTAS